MTSKAIVPNLTWLLLLVLVFQSSVLSDSLGLHAVSRIANAITLVAFILLTLVSASRKFSAAVITWFILPFALLLCGYAFNIARNLNVSTLGYSAMLMPWLAALSVPFLRGYDLKASWAMFYRFMLLFGCVAIVEYWVFFYGGWPTGSIETSRGPFAVGVFTIFTRLTDYEIHDRIYGVFGEPSTFAMMLMPAVAYALVFSKWFGLLVFLTCLFLTRSLGGFASLPVLLALFVYWRTRRTRGRTILVILLGGLAVYFFWGAFIEAYQEKGVSAEVREGNLLGFGRQFSQQLLTYPIGGRLAGDSLTVVGETDHDYLGSNLAPYVALVLGGVPAFIGYLAVVATTLWTCVRFFGKKAADKWMACAFISLPPLLMFVVQSRTIIDSAVFAFLFAAPVIAVLRGEWTVKARSAVRRPLRSIQTAAPEMS